MEKVVAIILARGGSKRLPRKNMQLFQGKPLVQVAIECAKGASCVGDIIVSTDDKEIAALARKMKAIVVMRPKCLCTDGAKSEDGIVHALIRVYGKSGRIPSPKMRIRKKQMVVDPMGVPLHYVLLQPTSPLRTSADVDQAANSYFEVYDEPDDDGPSLGRPFDWPTGSIVSVCYVKNIVGFVGGSFTSDFRRKDMKYLNAYQENGAIFFGNTRAILRAKAIRQFPAKIYIMPAERSVDIDTQFDLDLANWIASRKCQTSTGS